MLFVNYLPEFLYRPLKLSNVRLTDFANSKHAHKHSVHAIQNKLVYVRGIQCFKEVS